MARTVVSKRRGTTATPTTFVGPSSPNISVGDVVTMIGEVWEKADCTEFQKVPAHGIVVEKTGENGCRVATFGTVKVPFLLTPGSKYYLSTNGQVSVTEPNPDENEFIFSQEIGVAITDSELILSLKETYVLQPIVSYGTFLNSRKALLPTK